MVTAEIALALPALIGVVLALIWVIALGMAQGQVAQAAREGARAAARGESAADVRRTVAQLLPEARTGLVRDGRSVEVTVTLGREPPIRFLRPLARHLSASATSWRELP